MIALGDSVTGLVGRSVWTDERGDQGQPDGENEVGRMIRVVW